MSRSFIPFLAVVAWAASVPQAQGSDFWDEVRTPGLREWRHHVSEAKAALRARQWDAALDAADRAIGVLGDRALGHALRGRALGELAQPDEGARALERALELDPTVLDDAELGADAAELSAEGGHAALAARILERVLGRMRVTTRRYELYVLYGDVLLTLGPERLRDAILAYREGMRLHHGVVVRAALGLALALRRAGERLEATDLARQAAGRGTVDALIASLPVPHSEKSARRAVVLDALGDDEGAHRAWREATHGATWEEHARLELEKLSRTPTSRGGRRR